MCVPVEEARDEKEGGIPHSINKDDDVMTWTR